ncbi:hypothetical protein J3R83DRAFT_8862 [Lanmaoa asiatica]|nr:hypothetical protein J3R83DRAFT_8862 [Lanmaoa asiatica]
MEAQLRIVLSPRQASHQLVASSCVAVAMPSLTRERGDMEFSRALTFSPAWPHTRVQCRLTLPHVRTG